MNNDLLKIAAIKEIVDDWIGQVESIYGEDAALYYRAGLLDGVELLKQLSALYQEENNDNTMLEINKAFASSMVFKKTGGLN